MTNKLYKGKNYQNFIKCGKIVFRSFSYNNQMNLRVFSKDLQCNLSNPLPPTPPPHHTTIRHERVTFSRYFVAAASAMNSEVKNCLPLLFHDVGLYDIETSPLICYLYQWTGFYMIGTSVLKGLVTNFHRRLPLNVNDEK